MSARSVVEFSVEQTRERVELRERVQNLLHGEEQILGHVADVLGRLRRDGEPFRENVVPQSRQRACTSGRTLGEKIADGPDRCEIMLVAKDRIIFAAFSVLDPVGNERRSAVSVIGIVAEVVAGIDQVAPRFENEPMLGNRPRPAARVRRRFDSGNRQVWEARHRGQR